eukprot:COSAG01_NODE_7171_length_3319_cov_7.886957_1_plen_630_part_00
MSKAVVPVYLRPQLRSSPTMRLLCALFLASLQLVHGQKAAPTKAKCATLSACTAPKIKDASKDNTDCAGTTCTAAADTATCCKGCVAGTQPNAARSNCESCVGATYSQLGIACQVCRSPAVVDAQRTSCKAPTKAKCATLSACTAPKIKDASKDNTDCAGTACTAAADTATCCKAAPAAVIPAVPPPPAPVPAPAGGVPGPTLGWQEGECQGSKIGSLKAGTADKASCLAYCRSVPKVGCCRSEAGRAGKTAPFDCFAHTGTSFKSAKAGADPDWSYVISTVATPPPPPTKICPGSGPQTTKMMCAAVMPTCPAGQCAMRQNGGCTFNCQVIAAAPAPRPTTTTTATGVPPRAALGWQEGECQGSKIGSLKAGTADKASCLAYCRSVPKVGCCRSEAGRAGKTAPFDCFAHTGTSFKSAKAGADPDWSYVISSAVARPQPSPRKTTVTPPPAPAKSVVASVKLSTDITTIPAGSSASHNDLFCHSIFLSLNCKCCIRIAPLTRSFCAAARTAFEDSFATDVAKALGNIDKSRVVVTSITAGSIKVDFYVKPDASGQPLAATTITTAFKLTGVSIAGATTTTAITATTVAPPPAPAPAAPAPAAPTGSSAHTALPTALAGIIAVAVMCSV